MMRQTNKPRKPKNDPFGTIVVDEVKFLPTLDDWHPNFKRNTVRCSLYSRSKWNVFSVSVWGNDDMGMEREFENLEDAKGNV